MKRNITFLIVIALLSALSGCGIASNGSDTLVQNEKPLLNQEPFVSVTPTLVQNEEPPSNQAPFVSVTSGETIIYPLGHHDYTIQHDEQTGQGIYGCSFPDINEWADKLETVYYEPDFALKVNGDNATYSIKIVGDYETGVYGWVSCEDIGSLPAGNYTIACYLTTKGKYVKEADDYNKQTDVYWFTLIIP